MSLSKPLFAIPINDAAPWLMDAWDLVLTTREKMFLMNSATVRGLPSMTWNQFTPSQQIAIYDAMQRAVSWGESLRGHLFGAQFMAQQALSKQPGYTPVESVVNGEAA